MNKKYFEKHLIVFEDRAEYFPSNEKIEIFLEGIQSPETRSRTSAIKNKLESGFLESIISSVKNNDAEINLDLIDDRIKKCLETLVESVTSEVGRALIGLTVMQLTIKAIDKQQNIRLHKGGISNNSFSWQDGISMRVLDKNYVTPILRRYDLVKLNADGFMMTRSLAENYPYSSLYKANLKGARSEWLEIVEALESGTCDPLTSLKYFISLLFNKAELFETAALSLLNKSIAFSKKIKNTGEVLCLILNHIDYSDYSARLMEISMHALMQAITETGALGLTTLKPLSQMRSANKKHGNIGDIELLDNDEIIESWDAKYGKSYLRDEIDEATEKLTNHNSISLVGFVTTLEPTLNKDILNKIKSINELHGIEIKILTYTNWVYEMQHRALENSNIYKPELIQPELIHNWLIALNRKWLIAYVECICQKRRHIAPIDEPCISWVKELDSKITQLI